MTLANIHRDADQPRKTFNPQSLADFAETLWREGLINPISVTEEADGTFKVMVGERRWRAFGINQIKAAELLANTPDLPGDHPARAYEAWTTIPAFVERPIHPVDRRLLQLSENDREPLTLLERAESIAATAKLAKETLGLNGKEFAKKAGVSPQTLSAYISLLKRTGPTKRAVEAGRINDVKVLTLFQELNAEEQEALIERALLEDSSITRPMCAALIEAREDANAKKAKAAAASKATGAGSAPTRERRAEPGPDRSAAPVLSIAGLTFVHTILQEVGEVGDDEPLRLHAITVLHDAILHESPYIAISEAALAEGGEDEEAAA